MEASFDPVWSPRGGEGGRPASETLRAYLGSSSLVTVCYLM